MTSQTETVDGGPAPLPEGVSARRIRKALVRLGALVVLVVVAITLLPGLGKLRGEFARAQPGWIALGAVLEVLSALSYVLAFRGVFCTKMSWATTYKIALAEEGVDSLLPVGGAGGLALGAWALRRGGMPAEEIGRKTVAFFLLTSVPNVVSLALLGIALALGLLPGHAGLALTIVPAVVAIGAIAAALALGRFSRHVAERLTRASAGPRLTRLAPALRAFGDGVVFALDQLRRGGPLLWIGIVGYMVFDVLVLWASFRSLGSAPELAIVWIAYLIGQLGNLVPLPGGIGGVEFGLIGTFALYGVSAATATAAVFIYLVLELWIPAILGAFAFVQLRALLRREQRAIDICRPGEAVEIIGRGHVVVKPQTS
jgi:uncharacterized protein (TIRG00374 family)